uniref:Capsid protein n=1 Tax=Cygnus columbianus CRESS-DNA-virus sp. TaxID=2815027 RepID=A0A8A4XBY6_9VIRU|nr:MAG: capsid protein [Cygnus columbianus CRESS-DNA-virus sp.]
MSARNRFNQFLPFAVSRLRNSLNNRRSTARRTRFNMGRSKTMTRTRSRQGTSGIGVTTQHDERLIYRKRPMRGRKKRNWKRFTNKVHAVSEKDLGSQTAVFNVGAVQTNTSATQQIRTSFALYGMNSSVSFWNDMDTIGASLPTGAGAVTGAQGLLTSPSTKVIFKSGVLDLTIRNASTVAVSAGVTSFASEARMEVDVYECTIRRGDEEGVAYGTILDMLAQNTVRTDATGGAGTEVDIALRGVTPFDCTYSLANFGITILSKRKYQISNGDQVTYQIRDPRRHVMPVRELTSTEGPNKKGLTRCLIVIGKLAPGLPIGTSATPGNYQEILTYGITRKYLYKVENYSEDRTNYFNL